MLMSTMDAYLRQNLNDIQGWLESTGLHPLLLVIVLINENLSSDNAPFVLGSALTAAPGRCRSDQFKATIDHVYTRLCQILRGDFELVQPWRSHTASPDIAEHLNNLKIPTIDDNPSLLLHRLGETAEDSTILEEPKLRARRLENIFLKGKGQHSSVMFLYFQNIKDGHANLHRVCSVLFNTSGAGKTRLVLEGLCKEWGFYFTCNKDASECGSYDLDHVLGTDRHGYLSSCGLIEHPNDDESVRLNEIQAMRCFMAVLFARLMVFQCLLAAYEAQGKSITPAELKKIWLFVQLDCRLLADSNCPDSLLELTSLLCYIPTKKVSLPSHGYKMLEECKLFLRTLNSSKKLLPHEDSQVHIFCVIDEVQNAADLFPDAFRGGPLGTDARPVLRALLRIWSIGMHFVMTGTSLNIEHIQDALSSTIGKHHGHVDRAITSTGSFIYRDEQIDNYLNHYLPSLYLKSSSGKELSRRAKYWLVGRYVILTIGNILSLVLIS